MLSYWHSLELWAQMSVGWVTVVIIIFMILISRRLRALLKGVIFLIGCIVLVVSMGIIFFLVFYAYFDPIYKIEDAFLNIIIAVLTACLGFMILAWGLD